mgnify:CR=1 FL=1
MSEQFGSFRSSLFGAFVESPLNARDATGGLIYAGGAFTSPGNGVARWTGSAWETIGATGLTTCRVLRQHNAVLVAGGADLKTWDGSAWVDIGNGTVWDVTTWSALLIAVGYFSSMGGTSASEVASWNGSTWSALGSGTSGGARVTIPYGTDLLVAGNFGVPFDAFAVWDGSSWSGLGSPLNQPCSAAIVWNGNLYVGQAHESPEFTPDTLIARLRKWAASSWSTAATFNSVSIGAIVRAIVVYGNELIVGGKFDDVDGTVTAANIAAWNGTTWRAIGDANGDVFGLRQVGDELLAIGSFTVIGGVSSVRAARWNGTTWSAMSGLDAIAYTGCQYPA